MYKKILVFGSFLAVFLMLMTSLVNAVEYNQVKNNSEEKNIITSNNSADIEKLNEAINEMKDNPVSLCSSCGKNLLMRPKCKILLQQFNKLTWVILMLKEFCIIPKIVFFVLGLHALTVLYKARQIHCSWSFIYI